MGSLTNLEGLFLDTNQLTGGIAPELGSLTNLEYNQLIPWAAGNGCT